MARDKKEQTHPKVNNMLIAVVAIFAICFIVYFAINSGHGSIASTQTSNADNTGQAFTPITIDRTCNFMVSGTSIFDSSSLSAILDKGGQVFYQGKTISLDDTNSNGCVIDVNGQSDFVAVGQLQQIGPVYVLVKEINQ